MAKTDVEKYIDELRDFETEEKDMDLYSLKREIADLSASNVFDNFEKETRVIDKETLGKIRALSSLIKLRSLASDLKNKKQINDKLHTLHFNLNLLKNAEINEIKPIKNIFNLFLHSNETKIDSIINELDDFKAKLDEIKKHHSNLSLKSLDNKLKVENKYSRHIEELCSTHKKQKHALASTIKLFLKMTKKHIKNLKRFKNME